jgi:hypothetical protein
MKQEDRERIEKLWDIAYSFEQKGQLAEAEKWSRLQLDTCRRVFGEDHPETYRATVSVAGVLVKRGDLDTAGKFCREAVVGFLKHRQDNDVHLKVAVFGFCQVLELNALLAGKKKWDRQSEMLGLTDPNASQSTGAAAQSPEHRKRLFAAFEEWCDAFLSGLPADCTPTEETLELRLKESLHLVGIHETGTQARKGNPMSIKSRLLTWLGIPGGTPPKKAPSPFPMPVGCEVEAKDGAASGSSEVRVRCSKCGATVSPKKPDLARQALGKGLFIAMKCHRCGNMVEYGN